MKNRLQIRYCEKIFNNTSEIKSHLLNLFNKETSPLKPALAAEPLVLYYKESGDTAVNAVLAIGRPTSDDEYFLFDLAGIQKELNSLEDTASSLFDLPERLAQEIEDRISGDTRLETMIDENQEEIMGIIERICESAGFNNDGDDIGNYDEIAHDATHYIVSSTSLTNADILLDEAIWQNHVELIHAVESARTDLAVSVVNHASGRTLVSYDIKQGENVVGTIEIPTDRSISGGQLRRNEQGRWVLTFTVINENGSQIDAFDVDVEGLEDIYTGGEGIIVSGNVISVDFKAVLDETLAEIDGDINTLSGDVNTLKTDVNELSATVKTVSDEVSSNSEKISGLTQSLNTVSSSVETLREYTDAQIESARTYADNAADNALEDAKDYVDNKVTTIYRVKGSKTYFSELAEIEDPQVGDVWNIENEYRYTGNTGEIKIYPPGSNWVYVKDSYAAVGRWDPLGGETYDMSLYLSKEEFLSFSSDTMDNAAAINARINIICADTNHRIDELSAGTIREITELSQRTTSAITALSQSTTSAITALSGTTVREIEGLNDRIDGIVYNGDQYITVNNADSARSVSVSAHVLTDLNNLTAVTAPGQYLVDAYAIKTMKEQLEELIANSCNETMVKNIVSSMLIGKEREIGLEKTMDASGNAQTITIGFADDALFEAELPGDDSIAG